MPSTRPAAPAPTTVDVPAAPAPPPPARSRRPARGRRPRAGRAALALPLVALAVAAVVPAPAAAAPRAVAAAPWPHRAAPPAPGEGAYHPPVDAPVIDPFRPPRTRFGPGNRGLTYAVAPLTPVRAAGAGRVVFAGPVGGTHHVTVAHPDGLRTSYSFLAAVAVVPGEVVARGAVVGWSTEVLHLGVRDPAGTYLDPELLWRARWEPRLAPGGDDGTDAPAEARSLLDVVRERSGPLAAWLTTGVVSAPVGPAALEALDRRLRLWAHYAVELAPLVHADRLALDLERWWSERGSCTPRSEPVPPPAGRRIVVLVGGIGSTSEAAAIDGLDTAALGYAPGDVVRFSYAGGRIPPRAGGPDPFAAVPTSTYDAVASQQDLDVSGARLAGLLDEVAAAAPGVPIDVVAHSQGGVVARLGLAHADAAAALPAEVEHLVTLGSPHQGADLATAVEAARTDPAGAATLEQARRALGLDLDPALPAAGQLSEVSPVVGRLASTPPPARVGFTSVAARGDLTVTAGRTAAPGARRATVGLAGPSAHDELPRSPATTREVGLAIAGRAPTCRTFHEAVVDASVGDALGWLEDALGASLLGAGTAVPG